VDDYLVVEVEEEEVAGVRERQARRLLLRLHLVHHLNGAKLSALPHQHHHVPLSTTTSPLKGCTLKTWTIRPISPVLFSHTGSPSPGLSPSMSLNPFYLPGPQSLIVP
jgi:hypothetical protein